MEKNAFPQKIKRKSATKRRSSQEASTKLVFHAVFFFFCTAKYMKGGKASARREIKGALETETKKRQLAKTKRQKTLGRRVQSDPSKQCAAFALENGRKAGAILSGAPRQANDTQSPGQLVFFRCFVVHKSQWL